MMITRRDAMVAVLAVCGTLAVVGAQQSPPALLGSRTFDWDAMVKKDVAYGSTRAFFRAPTVTLAELEMHVTTLNPGQTSHAPHQHVNEELIIIKEGTIETLSLGVWKKVGPGSVIFNGSNDLHGVRNIGSTPATYHVVNWKSK
jgi:quercetin dioxygenase-like cupin family protein